MTFTPSSPALSRGSPAPSDWRSVGRAAAPERVSSANYRPQNGIIRAGVLHDISEDTTSRKRLRVEYVFVPFGLSSSFPPAFSGFVLLYASRGISTKATGGGGGGGGGEDDDGELDDDVDDDESLMRPGQPDRPTVRGACFVFVCSCFLTDAVVCCVVVGALRFASPDLSPQV